MTKKQSIPWIIAGVALIAFGVSFSQLHKERERYWKLYSLQVPSHRDVREFIIRAALVDFDRPIVVLGDSITEMARFPESINGYPVVNAGIGGATVTDFKLAGTDFLGKSKPSLLVIALGMNDALGQSASFVGDMGSFLAMVRTISPDILGFGITDTENGALVKDSTRTNQIIAAENADYSDIMNSTEQRFAMPPPFHAHHTIDGVPLNGPAYDAWLAELVAAISNRLQCSKKPAN